MVKKIKRAIQNKLNDRCYKKYLAEKERQSDCYRQWYLRNEDWKMKHFPPAADESELVFFADKNGILEEKAKAVTTAFFREHPYVQLAYADEDCIDENGKRYAPWFKPQWSPDTLAGFSYFGHFFAARRELLDAAAPELWRDCLTDCDSEKCHTLLLRLTDYITKQRWILANDKRKEIASIDKVLIHQKRMSEPFSLKRKPGKLSKDARVSIIIPSKDNPRVLATCIESIRRKTLLADAQGNALWMEILVIDNGSLPENRKILSEMAKQYAFSYHYEPMPFNFSKMCNLGAERAKGDYLLFLNDDMEIIQEDWLLGLLEMAAMPHAGAVGAKLLYPDTLQYHPTGAAFPAQIYGALVTEKVRSVGAMLINAEGEAFMNPLETRDVAAASIIRECSARKKGVRTPLGDAVWLDTPMIEIKGGKGTIEKRIPAMLRMFSKHGIVLQFRYTSLAS